MQKNTARIFYFLLGFLQFTSSLAQDTILVFHPTISNIEMITRLSEGRLWNENRADFHFLGVFHVSEQYDYQQSEDFLLNNKDIPFSLQTVDDQLLPETLYKENPCSDVFRSLFKSSRGAIFLGGPDLPPITYKEPMNHLTLVSDPGRHYLELSALFHFLGSYRNSDFQPFLEQKTDYTILGICLGMQTMNVATGGTMIQDIPTELYGYSTREEVLSNISDCHRNYNYDSPLDSIQLTGYHFHPISIKNKSTFSQALKRKLNSSPYVLSAHHQCVEKLGKGLVPAAFSIDEKIIEAVVHKKYPNVTGVQFHPEKSGLFNKSELAYVTPDSALNFKSFLIETDSEEFHEEFWKMIGENFLKSSAIPFQ